jgi:hypothetical protein
MSIYRISIIVLALLPARPAVADDKLDADAKLAFERGQTLYKDGRYAEARAEFSAGYELSHRAQFLFNMAECSRLNSEPTLARQQYERYLSEAPGGDLATLARQRLAALPPAPVEAARVTKALPPAPPVERRSYAVPIALGAGALAAVGGAIGFELWGDSLYARSKSQPDPTQQDSLWRSANTRRYLAEGLGVAGVGLASAAVWLYLRGEHRTVVAPMVGADRAAVVLSGTF